MISAPVFHPALSPGRADVARTEEKAIDAEPYNGGERGDVQGAAGLEKSCNYATQLSLPKRKAFSRRSGRSDAGWQNDFPGRMELRRIPYAEL